MPGRVTVRSVPVAIGLLILAGCSSKNPDALNAANLDENFAVAESNAVVVPDNGSTAATVATPVEPPANEATNNAQANIDAAVNALREADADMNEYCEAQKEATGESDCDED